MRTEAEIRKLRDALHRIFVVKKKACQCPDCDGNRILLQTLMWVLGEPHPRLSQSDIDRWHEMIFAEAAALKR